MVAALTLPTAPARKGLPAELRRGPRLVAAPPRPEVGDRVLRISRARFTRVPSVPPRREPLSAIPRGGSFPPCAWTIEATALERFFEGRGPLEMPDFPPGPVYAGPELAEVADIATSERWRAPRSELEQANALLARVVTVAAWRVPGHYRGAARERWTARHARELRQAIDAYVTHARPLVASKPTQPRVDCAPMPKPGPRRPEVDAIRRQAQQLARRGPDREELAAETLAQFYAPSAAVWADNTLDRAFERAKKAHAKQRRELGREQPDGSLTFELRRRSDPKTRVRVP